MIKQGIFITENDRMRLESLLAGEVAEAIGPKPYLRALREEIERARVVSAAEVPADVVTMNSSFRLRDLDTDEIETFTLVYPRSADIWSNKLSILAPIGTAVLGYRVGDIVSWPVPEGTRRLVVEEVLFQPERDGALNL